MKLIVAARRRTTRLRSAPARERRVVQLRIVCPPRRTIVAPREGSRTVDCGERAVQAVILTIDRGKSDMGIAP
jgi:hypothetical protein